MLVFLDSKAPRLLREMNTVLIYFISTSDKHLYVVELTIGFESNLTNNVNCKKAKYKT